MARLETLAHGVRPLSARQLKSIQKWIMTQPGPHLHDRDLVRLVQRLLNTIAHLQGTPGQVFNPTPEPCAAHGEPYCDCDK
jgi:hypothetical protein